MEMTLVGLQRLEVSHRSARFSNKADGHVSRHVTTLGLNDGQGGERASAVGLVELGGPLEETRVEVYIAPARLASTYRRDSDSQDEQKTSPG
jgi:hypothetical protein